MSPPFYVISVCRIVAFVCVCVNQGHSVVVEQMKRSLVESGSAEESQSHDTAGMSACTMCTEWLIVHCQTSLLLIFF